MSSTDMKLGSTVVKYFRKEGKQGLWTLYNIESHRFFTHCEDIYIPIQKGDPSAECSWFEPYVTNLFTQRQQPVIVQYNCVQNRTCQVNEQQDHWLIKSTHRRQLKPSNDWYICISKFRQEPTLMTMNVYSHLADWNLQPTRVHSCMRYATM